MYPWGHLAVGYLCYSLGVRLWNQRPPAGVAMVPLAIGTQFPDLVDKPLSWTFDILPSGRSLGHSILVALVIALTLWYAGRKFDRRTEAVAFFSGYLLHIIADMSPFVVSGEWKKLGSVLWPLVPAYQYPGESDRTIIEFLSAIDLTSVPAEAFVLIILTVSLWMYDELPGADILFNED